MAGTESFLAERREALRAITPAPPVNGIDYVEIQMAAREIEVHLVHPLPGTTGGVPQGADTITAGDIRITGGTRIRDVRVTGVFPTADRTLVVTVADLGDFSVYTLSIDHPGLDPMLAQIRFQFRAACATDFDCVTDTVPVAGAGDAAGVNYLAKDYESFRSAMFDRMAALVPDWQDRQAADLGVTLIELMAHYADHLSYAQDAVATEGYINTARRRASVKRHARLIGYDVQDGLSARVFVQVHMAGSGAFAPQDLLFLTRSQGLAGAAVRRDDLDIAQLLRDDTAFFEPVAIEVPDPAFPGQDRWLPHPIRLHAAANDLVLYDWSDPRAVLPKGATSAWIRAVPGLDLRPGDLVALELARDPVTLRAADADPAWRQVVCLTQVPVAQVDAFHAALGRVDVLQITWGQDDALRFDLPIGGLADVADDGPPRMARAAGNIVLASHGVSLTDPDLLGTPDSDDDPERADAITALAALDRPDRFRPVLRDRDISVSGPQRMRLGETSARRLVQAGSFAPVKAVTVSDSSGLADWQAVNTLLFARDDDRVFVPETESDGTTVLRFGARDTGGQMPDPDQPLVALTRVGIGRRGNIGADTIAHVALSGVAGPVGVRNPLPGFGGRDRDAVQDIKLGALRQLDDNLRAVTRADYARLAETHQRVQRAFVHTLGHGSWTTVVVAVDPLGSPEAGPDLLDDVRDHLEPYRLMGQDLIVTAPDYAPLDIGLRICVCRGHHDSAVRQAVAAALSSDVGADGTQGFFHPDRISFGDPIYLSRIVAAVRAVPGVADVAVDRFCRWRTTDTLALRNGVIAVAPSEIPILMNDRNFPEHGVLRVSVWEAA